MLLRAWPPIRPLCLLMPILLGRRVMSYMRAEKVQAPLSVINLLCSTSGRCSGHGEEE